MDLQQLRVWPTSSSPLAIFQRHNKEHGVGESISGNNVYYMWVKERTRNFPYLERPFWVELLFWSLNNCLKGWKLIHIIIFSLWSYFWLNYHWLSCTFRYVQNLFWLIEKSLCYRFTILPWHLCPTSFEQRFRISFPPSAKISIHCGWIYYSQIHFKHLLFIFIHLSFINTLLLITLL